MIKRIFIIPAVLDLAICGELICIIQIFKFMLAVFSKLRLLYGIFCVGQSAKVMSNFLRVIYFVTQMPLQQIIDDESCEHGCIENST